MAWWEAALLGVIQGLTEFLPVSSSGHLVIFQEWLGVRGTSITFDIVVHLGSLVAVLVALKADWIPIVRGVFGKDQAGGRKRLLLVIVGTLPIVIVGLLFKGWVETLFQSTRTVGIMLLVTGTLLLIADRIGGRSGNGRATNQAKDGRTSKNLDRLTVADALWVGCGQALAVVPGLSRSGTTIAAGMLRRVDRESAARFAFLLSIPAILGAVVLEVPALLSGTEYTIGILAIGAGAAAVSGYFAISTFLRFLRSGSLLGFSIYTWAVGLLVLIAL